MDEIKLHQFAEKLELLGYSKRVIKDYPANVRLFFRYLDENENVRSIDDITPEHITAYHTHLHFGRLKNGDRLSGGSVGARLVALRAFFRVMHTEGLFPQDYEHLVHKPKRRTSLPGYVPSVKEMLALLDAVRPADRGGAGARVPLAVRDKAMLELLYATGVRNEELRSLTLSNFDASERTLFVTGKGSKDRVVPIGDWVMPYLQEYLETARPKLARTRELNDLLFISKTGRMITNCNLGSIVTKYVKAAGLEARITPHGFRHACATHLLKAGADIRYVQELLGHADLSSTQIYTKLDITFLKEAHKKYHPRERAEDGERAP